MSESVDLLIDDVRKLVSDQSTTLDILHNRLLSAEAVNPSDPRISTIRVLLRGLLAAIGAQELICDGFVDLRTRPRK